jgi:hypothetical protein
MKLTVQVPHMDSVSDCSWVQSLGDVMVWKIIILLLVKRRYLEYLIMLHVIYCIGKQKPQLEYLFNTVSLGAATEIRRGGKCIKEQVQKSQ